MAEEIQTGPEAAFQGMEDGGVVENSSELMSDCGAVHPAKERTRGCGDLVCDVRSRGWRTVSV